MADDTQESGLRGDERIIAEAKRKFKGCQEWESNARKLWLDDIKFDAADPDNGYQWPSTLYNDRIGADKPCLTVNKTHQHNLQIINDGKQNTPSIKIRPVGGEANEKSAEVYNGVIRHIEYISNAKSAYDTAYSFSVRGGIGYIRVTTDYVGDDTFDQDLKIGRVKDPLSVFLDPDINEADGSDARFGFVFESRPKDEVIAKYPKIKDKVAQNTLTGGSDDWFTTDHIRIAEYYRKVSVKDYLVLLVEPDLMPDGTPNPNAGQQSMVRKSKVPKEILELASQVPGGRVREIRLDKVEWFKIVGDEIVERRVGDDALPIPYIPIARVIGEETVIDGKLDRKGHTRALKDPQRMFNYNASAMVEYGGVQSKTPYLVAARAYEGYETYWNTANRVNHAALVYRDLDPDNPEIPIPRPERQQPPMAAPVYLQGMQDAERQMMMVSGQYQAQTGEQENARSGKAINARQRQGDNATYHFIDNLAMAIRYVGKILIAWIPHVYDTPRVIRILGEDGSEREVTIDPNAKQALTERKSALNASVETIFNPNVGRYDVISEAGPGFATKRQEAFNAFAQVAAQNPEAMQIIGDYLFKAMDVPYADEIAERYRRAIPANLKGEGPPPEVADLTLQLENMKTAFTDLIQQVAEQDIKLKAQSEDKQLDAYKAETDRMKVIGIPPQAIGALLAQLVQNALATNVVPEETLQDESAELRPAEQLAAQQQAQSLPAMQGVS